MHSSRRQQRALLLLLLGCSSNVPMTRAQEEAGEDAQVVDEVAQDGVDNSQNDIGVAAIWHDELLYTAITTTGFLGDNVNENAGDTDIVIKSFDDSLTENSNIQIGSDGDDFVTAMAGDLDVQGDFVIVGSTLSTDTHLFDTQTDATGETDWFIATMSRSDLEITGSYVNGTLENDQQATAVAIDPTVDGGGTYYVAGWTWGEYFATNVGSDNPTDSVGYDAWVLKISEFDVDVEPEWGIQFGTVAYDTPSALLAYDSTVYVVGSTRDDSNVLSAAEEAETYGMFVRALDGDDGTELWAADENLGFLSDSSEAHGAVLNDDGSELFVAGNTQGIIPGYDGDTTDSDELFVVSIDTSDGTVNWVWQSEGNATAFGTGGVVMADDGVSPIVSGIAFGNQFNLTFTYWEDGSGDMIAAKIDPDDLEVSKYFVAAAARTTTREQAMAMVKDPDVTDGVFLIGKEDGDFTDRTVIPEADPTSTTDENYSNFLALKVQLEVLPEEEDPDNGRSFPYWYVGVPVFAVGGVLFVVAYKWAAASQAAKAKAATMV